MKKIFFFLFLLFIPTFVYAEDLVLKDLIIKNGELSLPFEKYNTEYTVTLEETEFNIDFEYKVEDGVTVAINNNHDLENNSVVTLTLAKDENSVNYKFHILKESEENIPVFNENVTEINNNFMYKYKIYIIPSVCFTLILIIYKILFRKHKKKII